MSLGFIQILLILLVGFLLFGNFPKKVQEILKAWKLIRKEISDETEKKIKKL